LSPRDLRTLRARAHGLKPVVWIAATGPTEGVLRELDRALNAHELVKIRVDIDQRDERSRLLQSLCDRLGALPVQTIGKILVAYRPRPEAAAPSPARIAAGRRAAGKSPSHGKRAAARAPGRGARAMAPGSPRSRPGRRKGQRPA
jgi:putative YhbY family RNA-binding protein